jgi:chromosome partitioning protein
VIPRNVRLSEAPSHGKPILLYDARSTGATAYLELAGEILERLPTSASHAPLPAPAFPSPDKNSEATGAPAEETTTVRPASGEGDPYGS